MNPEPVRKSRPEFVSAAPSLKSHIRQLVGQIHYAFLERPPVVSPARAAWDDTFLHTVERLSAVIDSVKIPDLPPLVIGVIYAWNLAVISTGDPRNLDIESITSASEGSNHPAFKRGKGTGYLRYAPSDNGQVGLLSRTHVTDKWWIKLGEFLTAYCHPRSSRIVLNNAQVKVTDVFRRRSTMPSRRIHKTTVSCM